MIAYFDSSAAVPLLVEDEPGASACRRVWATADAVVASRVLYVEVAAALARAERLGRLTAPAHQAARAGLDVIWAQVDVVEVTDTLVRRAAQLARDQSLRGFDALHYAAALSLAGPTTVALAGDAALLRAWRATGLDVIDTSTGELGSA
ncbi:type II toxin-antitoxin system VapC family toxin [Geodermatophilus maliterrae]|uniref:Ribonuclease VapC n=1 Tax=Geodermatophilus maliterrae TaxID=3162531 RepID=A0ABV3XDG1_9ACTN